LVYSSIDAYFSDLNSINEIVREQTGSYSNIIRFPGGSSNTVSRNYTVGIMSQLSSLVESKGYKYFDWNVSSGDASSVILDSSSYAQNVINGLGNGSYYVVLQHDTNVNSIRAVSKIIEYGLSHGYSFRAIDINSPTVHHRIAN
jgi:peptidoglycan/xylan/chitin deacetylase (PgdA/CDA1 family)